MAAGGLLDVVDPPQRRIVLRADEHLRDGRNSNGSDVRSRTGCRFWFTAYCDLLVCRDPFHYYLIVGVEVGARFRIEICFFGCVDIDVSVSLGADLHIDGPPLHGTVSVDLAISSVTVEFGDAAQPKPPQLNWDQFTLKYLKATDPPRCRSACR